ncbi:hypothetical protein [Kordia sp.]|uniref:hypothetical protein n=1 Tax=Kordia sp. TaxID=1965332 RepID=UPI0025C20C5B|nr:hypothetical protein [Kordia sp.]MCH2193008.1 hypothetical protein [Kordia sp.]
MKKRLKLQKLSIATLTKLNTIKGGTMSITTCGTMGGDTSDCDEKSKPKTICLDCY